MKKRLLFLVAAAALFFSCSGIVQNGTETQNSADGGTYLVIGSASMARSIAPSDSDKDASNLVSFVLKGTREEDEEITLAGDETPIADLAALSEQRIPIQTGSWSFTLTAKLNGVAFSGTTTATIVAETTNTISFEMKAVENYGGMSVTVNFSDTNVTEVVATLKTADKSSDIGEQTFEKTDFVEAKDDEGNLTGYSVTYSRSASSETERLERGSYYLVFEFYADGTTVPINSPDYIVRVASGITTTAAQTISLNETYSVTYNDNDDAEHPAELASGETKVMKYSRKSESITLPQMTRTGYIFGGWYTDSDCVEGKITEIPTGSTGNLTLWAKWELKDVTVTYKNLILSTNSITPVVTGTTTTTGKYGENAELIFEDTENLALIGRYVGCTFVGWTADGETVYQRGNDTFVLEDDVTLYAVWSLECETVCWCNRIVNGVVDAGWVPSSGRSLTVTGAVGTTFFDTAFEAACKEYSADISNLPEILQTGFTYKENDSSYDTVGNDKEHYTYRANPCFLRNEHTVTYNNTALENAVTKKYLYGETIALADADDLTIVGTNEGKYLSGWATEENGDVVYQTGTEAVMPDEDLTLFAVWIDPANASGSTSTDNRALNIAIDKTTLYLNSTVTFTATDATGEVVTSTDSNPLKWSAQILYKGNDVNSLADTSNPYYTVDATAGTLSLSVENPLPAKTYQIYVTVSQPVNASTAAGITATSSQTFEVTVENEPVQMVLYESNSSGKISYCIADSATATFSETASGFADTFGMSKKPLFAFDDTGNMYYIATEGTALIIKSTREGFPTITTEVTTASYNKYHLAVDRTTDTLWLYAYIYGSGSNEKINFYGYENISTITDAPSTADKHYIAESLDSISSPTAFAVDNGMFYIAGDSYLACVNPLDTLADGKFTGSDSVSLNLSAVGLNNYPEVTDVLYQDGYVYVLVSEKNVSIDENIPGDDSYNYTSKGAVIRVVASTKEVSSPLGLVSTPIDTSAGYMYAYSDDNPSGHLFTSNADYTNTANWLKISCSDTNTLSYSSTTIGEGLPKLYAPASLSDTTAFFGPVKFIAINPKKLVIADDGFAFYTDANGAYCNRNANRVVEVDLETFAITSATETSANFGYTSYDLISSGFTTIESLGLSGSVYAENGSSWAADSTTNIEIGIPLGTGNE